MMDTHVARQGATNDDAFDHNPCMNAFIQAQEQYDMEEFTSYNDIGGDSTICSLVIPDVAPIISQMEPSPKPFNHSMEALHVSSAASTAPPPFTALAQRISSTRKHPSKHFV